MAYSTVGFKDGSTPLDATNMNKMDNQIKQNADDISSLNDTLTNTVQSQVGNGKVTLRKVGNVASIYYLDSSVSFSGTSTVIFTLPEEFRPSVTTYVLGRVATENDRTAYIFCVGSDGNVTQNISSSSTITSVGIAATYLL